MHGRIGRRRFANLAGAFCILAAISASSVHAQYSTTTLDIGPAPGRIAINPVTNTIYVGRNVLGSGSTSNTIVAIDGGTNAVSTIAVGGPSSVPTVNAVTNQIYVSGSAVVAGILDGTVTVIDGATYSATTVPIGPDTGFNGCAIDPVTNKIYVNCGSTVAEIDGATNTVTSLAVGGGDYPDGIAVNPVANKVYASSYTIFDSEIPSFLDVIDGATGAATPFGGGNDGFLAVNPATNKVYVSVPSGGYGSTGKPMSVVDGTTGVATSLNVGVYAYEVVVNPVTNKVYVACIDSDTLTVIDGATNAASTITLGRGDSGYEMAVNPVTNKIFVDNADSGTLTVIDGATNSTTSVAVGAGTGDIVVNPVTNRVYLTNTNDGTLTVIDGNVPGTPSFSSGPESLTVNAGTPVALNAVAIASGPLSYRWFANGLPLSDGVGISGSSTGTLYLSNGATQDDTGVYTCVATNAAGSASSSAAALTVVNVSTPGRLIDLSCRALVDSGVGFVNFLIAGFETGGKGTSGPETVLIRASGPALAPFGVTGALPDPDLTLSNPTIPIATNIIWGGSAQISSVAAAVGAFPWTDPSSHDAALVESLPPGVYTALVAGHTVNTGIALAEVYDATPADQYTPATTRLTNISARTEVGVGANILIAGFEIGGTTSETVLIRASGPALTPLGVVGVLPDPQLQLSSSSGPIASNAGWGGNAQIAAAAASVGAFSWGSVATPDSAILITLPPGAYTAEVSGASGDVGAALVEVYEVQ
jgi:DNA-binding beta-propeller fold protein YncE